jgi:signal transduction histidine kinase
MPEPLPALLSTILSLPDDRRVDVERELVALGRTAALGELAAGVAHDVANPLFGVLGLVDLLLEDADAGSADEARLRLVQQAALDMKSTLRVLLDFARPADDGPARAALDDAVREALVLLRHGTGRFLEVDERYPDEPAIVPCPPGALVQAVLHLLLAGGEAERLEVEVGPRSLRISPSPPESLGVLVAGRIVVDHGGTIERTASSVTLRFVG